MKVIFNSTAAFKISQLMIFSMSHRNKKVNVKSFIGVASYPVIAQVFIKI